MRRKNNSRGFTLLDGGLRRAAVVALAAVPLLLALPGSAAGVGTGTFSAQMRMIQQMRQISVEVWRHDMTSLLISHLAGLRAAPPDSASANSGSVPPGSGQFPDGSIGGAINASGSGTGSAGSVTIVAPDREK